MDPLALSGAFATIVGLLASFKAERSTGDLSEFMTWLREHHQEQLAASIASSQAVSRELAGMLALNHDVLLQRLDDLHAQIRSVASQVEGFAGLAAAVSASPVLSTQARSILHQIAASGAKYVMEHKMFNGRPNEFVYIGGTVGQVKYDEPQFIDEDLEKLVTLQLLRLEYAGKGSRKYSLTRAGAAYARSDA